MADYGFGNGFGEGEGGVVGGVEEVVGEEGAVKFEGHVCRGEVFVGGADVVEERGEEVGFG